MIFPFGFRHAKGFTYVELLAGLFIVAMIFPPAYRFAGELMTRGQQRPQTSGEAELAMDVVARDLRCAMDAENEPFHANGDELSFMRATPDEPVLVDYRIDAGANSVLRRDGQALCEDLTGWTFRFFNGETWTPLWGWDGERQMPTEGVRGLPLAVEVSAHLQGITLRRVVPLMTAVLDRWPS